MIADPVLSIEFAGFMQNMEPVSSVALALSGGPDSMALAWLLRDHCAAYGRTVHALTVNHGLRPEAGAEAETVNAWVGDWPGLEHHILTLKVPPRGMAAARDARFAALAAWCAERGIVRLFLAHHQDDQAETLLFRLAKGSGLDGLGAMRPLQPYNQTLTLARPLLGVAKARLIATCEHHGLPFVSDPTNTDPLFARSRLRAARAALEAEGLTTKRLATTARRLQRAGAALTHYADAAFAAARRDEAGAGMVFDFDALALAPPEIRLRVLVRATGHDRAVRREKLEALADALFAPAPFARRTLGGYIFQRDDDGRRLVIRPEKTGV